MASSDCAACNETEALYVSHRSWLQGWFVSRLGCAFQSADLTQDVFVRVLSRQETLRSEPLLQPRAFLRVIAKGLLIDHYRRQSVEQAFRDALTALPNPIELSAEDRQVLLETLDQIDAMLDKMRSPVRRAFLRSQLDGLTYAEIAEEMDVSVRTIKRYMQQGFRECLAATL